MPFCFQDENCFLHDYGTFTIMVHLSTKMIGKALILIFFNFQATFIIFQIYYIPILIFPNHIKESILTIIIL
jgi:succinate-acetate transporter protein